MRTRFHNPSDSTPQAVSAIMETRRDLWTQHGRIQASAAQVVEACQCFSPDDPRVGLKWSQHPALHLLGAECECGFDRVTQDLHQTVLLRREIDEIRTRIASRKQAAAQRIAQREAEIQTIKDEWFFRFLFCLFHLLGRILNLVPAWRTVEEVQSVIQIETDQLGRFIADQEQMIKDTEASIASHHEAAIQKARSFERWCRLRASELLARNRDQLEALLDGLPPYVRGRLEPPRWTSFKPSEQPILPVLTIGDWVEAPRGGVEEFRAPLFVPLIGSHRTTVVVGKNGDSAKALAVLHGILIRLAAMFGHRARFLLLDPHLQGRSFPMAKQLQPFLRPSSGNVQKDLEAVEEEVSRIVRTYLDGECDSFEKLPPSIQQNEKWEIIMAAHFPKDYTKREVEFLRKISRNGTHAGRYVFIHHSPD